MPVREAGEKAEGELRLTKHSYRAGCGMFREAAGSKKPNGSSASTMAPSDLDDGFRLFFPPHRNPRLVAHAAVWQIAAAVGPDSRGWVQAQKAALTPVNCAFSSAVSCLSQPSRGTSSKSNNICGKTDAYAARKAGFPISSGTVELRGQNLDSAAYETSWQCSPEMVLRPCSLSALASQPTMKSPIVLWAVPGDYSALPCAGAPPPQSP